MLLTYDIEGCGEGQTEKRREHGKAQQAPGHGLQREQVPGRLAKRVEWMVVEKRHFSVIIILPQPRMILQEYSRTAFFKQAVVAPGISGRSQNIEVGIA